MPPLNVAETMNRNEDKIEKWGEHQKSKAALFDMLPDNEEDILRFLDSAVLEDQPTEVLVQLAQKLKERRAKIYQDNNNQNSNPQ
jgi:hypothetical protein